MMYCKMLSDIRDELQKQKLELVVVVKAALKASCKCCAR